MKNFIDNKTWKFVIILVCIITVVFYLYSSYLKEKNSCLGVQILSESDIRQYTEYEYQDFSNLLRHKDELVSMDVENSTIYISQNINEETIYNDLQGILSIDDAKYQLYFVEDEAFQDLDEAVRTSHSFTLLVSDGSPKYMQYHVIFTTLPLVRLDGEVTHQDEEGRNVLTGDICIWTPIDPDSNGYTVKSSALEWHHRGGTTANLNKKSWKISLKKEDGENANLSICGLGSDDDWVLNAMALDDTKMREKLFMDLWNEVAVENDYSYQMSSGEYVEVIANGEYLGLYMVQRRIDSKYLGLGEGTALVRGRRLLAPPASVQDGYEIRESDLPEDEVYTVMYHAVYAGQWLSLVDLDNFIDTNLFIGMAVAPDNAGFNNMYWVIEKTDDEELPYRISMVPWDTDMSFGIVVTGGFVFDYNAAIHREVARSETGYMMTRLGYVEQVFERWKELRESTLTREHILAYLEEYDKELMSSGAYNRNVAKWGIRKGEKEYKEAYKNLITFIEDRLECMDSIYMQ